MEAPPWLKRANRPGGEFARRVLESSRESQPAVKILNNPVAEETAGLRSESPEAELGWRAYAGAQALASILDELDPAARQMILNDIASDGPNSFTDLAMMDETLLRLLTGRVERRVLVTALKGASPKVADRFAKASSSGEAAALRADLRDLGPVRLREVQAAQQQVLREVRVLTGKER